MFWEALWSVRLFEQPLLSMDIVWVLPAELSEQVNNSLILRVTESPQVILVWVWYLPQVRPKSRKLSLELFHFKIQLYFFNVLRFCQELYYIFMVFRLKNLVSIREYMNFNFIEENTLVGRGMQVIE